MNQLISEQSFGTNCSANKKKQREKFYYRPAENIFDNDDLYKQKATLLTEISHLHNEVNKMMQEYNDMVDKESIEFNDELSFSSQYNPKTAQEMRSKQTITQEFNKLDRELDLLDQQINFFSSLFTDDTLTKLEIEIEAQKEALAEFHFYIENAQYEIELKQSTIQTSDLSQRKHSMNIMQKEEHRLKSQLYSLQQSERKLNEHMNVLMECENARDKDSAYLASLRLRYKNLHKKKEIKQRELRDLNKMHEKNTGLLDDIQKKQNAKPKKVRIPSKRLFNPDGLYGSHATFKVKEGPDSEIFNFTQAKSYND